MWYFLLFKKYKCLNVDIHLKLDINCLFLQQLMFERSEPAAVRVLHHSWFRPEPSLPAWPSSSSLFFSVAVQPSLHFTLPPHPAPHPPQSHYWDSPSSSHHTLMTGYKMFQGRRPGHTQPHSHPVSTALAPLLSSLLWIPLWAQKPDVSFCPDHNAASQQVVHFSFWAVFLHFFPLFLFRKRFQSRESWSQLPRWRPDIHYISHLLLVPSLLVNTFFTTGILQSCLVWWP